MSHIEGDGVSEDLYYLLWRKDSPFNEKLKIRIPDTVIFRHGRPIAWYFTNNDGVVLRKKPTSLTYPEIQKKFTRGVTEGSIVAYFINVDKDKKMERIINKNVNQEEHEKEEKNPSHNVDYFGLHDFMEIFSDYKNFEGKNGILQRFIHPYGSNNELIQAVWSPRVCVFTKRVNLRRLNENRIDVYERALTFDGPDFYSKNVPLRGGYIPGKLRSTCDLIVRHIAYISYEKISIKRMVGYFKVDREENVWFLWTSSIRINETSKLLRKHSKFIDKPLCLEPCIQTSEAIRHIKTNFATRPVSLRLDETCTICHKKLAGVSLISVPYKLLLSNESILKKAEELAIKDVKKKGYATAQSFADRTLIDVNKGAIGIPAFIKKLHPGMTNKEFQQQKIKDHFMIQTTEVCEECYLLVSVEYEGGYPYKLTLPRKRPMTTTGTMSKQNMNLTSPSQNNPGRTSYGTHSIDEESPYDSNEEAEEYDNKANRFILTEHDVHRPMTSPGLSFGTRPQTTKAIRLNSDDLIFADTTKAKAGVVPFMGGLHTAKSAKSGFLNKFLRSDAWVNANKASKTYDFVSLDSYTEETKGNSTQADQSSLKHDLVKAFGADYDELNKYRTIKSAKPDESKVASNLINKKPARPQTSTVNRKSIGSVGNARQLKLKEYLSLETEISNKHKSKELLDIFADSASNFSGYDSLAEKQRTITSAHTDTIPSVGERPNTSQYSSQPYLRPFSPEIRIQQHLDQDIHKIIENEHKPLARSQSSNSKRKFVAPVGLSKGQQNTIVMLGNRGSRKSQEFVPAYVSIYSGAPKLKSSATGSTVSSVRTHPVNKYFKYVNPEEDDDIQRELEDRVETLMVTQQQTTKPSSRRHDIEY